MEPVTGRMLEIPAGKSAVSHPANVLRVTAGPGMPGHAGRIHQHACSGTSIGVAALYRLLCPPSLLIPGFQRLGLFENRAVERATKGGPVPRHLNVICVGLRSTERGRFAPSIEIGHHAVFEPLIHCFRTVVDVLRNVNAS